MMPLTAGWVLLLHLAIKNTKWIKYYTDTLTGKSDAGNCSTKVLSPLVCQADYQY